MEIPLDEVIFFDAITSTPATGAAVDGDSAPTFSVFEEATDTDIGIGGSMTKRTSLTGNYRGTFTVSAANGFEVGKWYSIIAIGIVGGVTGKAVLKNFRVVAAEAITGKPKVDADGLAGQTITAAAGVTFPASVASPTNITAGTITTVTNLTNAPTAGDLTAAMKASVTTAATAATPTVTAGTVSDKTGYTLSGAGVTAVQAGLATQADINALNQSASRRIMLVTVPQYERPESGTNSYTVEMRLFDGDGAAVNADSEPTLTATGAVSGNLSANLSASSNPATGVYRWTYSELAAAALEQIRIDGSAAVAAATFTLSVYTQSADFVAATWSATDQSNLTAIFNKLPTNNIADQTLLTATLTTIAGYIDSEVAAILAAVDTEVAAIKVWTDRLGTAMELDGAVYRFTTNALEQAPAGGGGLTGANSVTIEVTDGVNPLEGAKVRVTHGVDTDIKATDTLGRVVFALDAFTWDLLIDMVGYAKLVTGIEVTGNPTNPPPYELTQNTTTPSASDRTTCHLTIEDIEGNAVIGQAVTFEYERFERTATGEGVQMPQVTNLTAAGGRVEFVEIHRLARYRVKIGDDGPWYRGTTNNTDTTPLINAMGAITI